ncbi:MAG: HPP family protein [Candidatus Hydrothermarchaeales archaeon]
MEEIKRYTVPSIKIKDLRKIMEHKVVTVQKDYTIEELVTKFREYDFHGFPVLDKDELVGVVTKTDLLKIITITERKLSRMFASHVEDIMTPHPITITPKTNLLEAVDIMNKNRIRTLPILDGERLVGLLSYSDLVKTVFKF